MEPRSGRGHGDTFVQIGIDGLVAFVVVLATRVILAALDVGGQGQNAKSLRKLGDRFVAFRVEADAVVAVAAGFQHFGLIFARQAEVARVEGFFAGLEQAAPCARVLSGL